MADGEKELPLALVEEHILVRLDVKDLLRFKSVCKSWRSLISTPRFVKAHLNRSYLNDRNNHHLGHRRIQCPLQLEKLTTDTWFSFADHSVVVGSCNGLVCVSPHVSNEFVVTNPSTREVKKLPTPPLLNQKTDNEGWGFGYDSAIDDYKVIIVFRTKPMSTTQFHVLTLRSNTWKVIEEAVNYNRIMFDMMGVFCDRELHWLIEDAEQNVAIMSFDLSTEEFKTIPLPAPEENYNCDYYRLGIIEECLCMYHSHSRYPVLKKIWVMRSKKWEVYNLDTYPESSIKYDVVHRLTRVSNVVDYYTEQTTDYLYLGHEGKLVPQPKGISYVYGLDDGQLVPGIGVYDDMSAISANMFVKSLVSPNPHPHNYAKQQGQKDNGSVESKGEGSSLGKRNRSELY